MPSRPNRTSACCRRFAGHKSLTLDETIAAAPRALPAEINKRSIRSLQVYRFGLGGIAVFDAFVFEFMGLAMFALCVVVLAAPSGRRPTGRVSDH